MARPENNSEIALELGPGKIVLRYRPKTERTVYDICDLNGRVVKTGIISAIETILDASDLFQNKYVMLIVDGDQLMSKSFTIAA